MSLICDDAYAEREAKHNLYAINYSIEMDSIFKEYADQTINNSQLMESDYRTNSVYVSNPKTGFQENIDDKMAFSVYTFENTHSIEPRYDTFIDYYFTDPMEVYHRDKLMVEISDFLRPVSPINSIMFTKSHPDDNWEFVKELIPVMNSLQNFTLEGDQLSNQDGYSRVIIHFSSYANDDSPNSELPEYDIQYTHDTSGYIAFSWTTIITLFLTCLIFVYFFMVRKGLIKNQMNRYEW
ncbi:hypothetical protein [Gracilibacillus phocaeensis]|uniref:hypothetical protein n=1 Tax=Gracilibacillus phocaeensis TaxID=2042304 RepID=UPI0013EF59E9|nr:hypothetical protein [Gracilibacillus phocaeensis]